MNRWGLYAVTNQFFFSSSLSVELLTPKWDICDVTDVFNFNFVTSDPGKTLPEALDYCTVWLQTVPGEIDSKSGIPPSLVMLQIKDFLNGPGKKVIIQMCVLFFSWECINYHVQVCYYSTLDIHCTFLRYVMEIKRQILKCIKNHL